MSSFTGLVPKGEYVNVTPMVEEIVTYLWQASDNWFNKTSEDLGKTTKSLRDLLDDLDKLEKDATNSWKGFDPSSDDSLNHILVRAESNLNQFLKEKEMKEKSEKDKGGCVLL